MTTITSAQDTRLVQTASGAFPVIDQGKGIPILLLHGFPDSKELWKYQIPALVKAGFRVIAPDLRGYGNAPGPLEKEEYALPNLMTDVIGILDALELEKVNLVGHDWGAALSWNLIRYYKERFSTLIALSVGIPGNSGWSSIDQRQKSWYFYLFLQEGLAEKSLADYDWKLAKEILESHPERNLVLERFKEGNNLTKALNWYRGNLQDRLTQPNVDYSPAIEKTPTTIEKIGIPILGIWSDSDIFLTEAQMKHSSELATNFTYNKIKGAGHWMMLDKPDKLNTLMLNFLTRYNE